MPLGTEWHFKHGWQDTDCKSVQDACSVGKCKQTHTIRFLMTKLSSSCGMQVLPHICLWSIWPLNCFRKHLYSICKMSPPLRTQIILRTQHVQQIRWLLAAMFSTWICDNVITLATCNSQCWAHLAAYAWWYHCLQMREPQLHALTLSGGISYKQRSDGYTLSIHINSVGE